MVEIEKRPSHSYLVMDGQFGSTGKGLLAGYLAETRGPTAVVCAFSPNAGHTYITSEGVKFIVTQVPVGIISKRCRVALIGPGSVINPHKFLDELHMLASLGVYDPSMTRVAIHPHAAIVHDGDAGQEQRNGLSNIGSTLKGTSIATQRKLNRNPDIAAVAGSYAKCDPNFGDYVCESSWEYDALLDANSYVVQIEGAQGFSLSLNHGFYPYVTSRDVTPNQIYNDCAIPAKIAQDCHVYQSLRTYPIRVNNRTGSSGPGYPDQEEISWDDIGVEPELTTVTQLQRRVFTWSHLQMKHMVRMCGKPHGIFLNFVNYVKDPEYLAAILVSIQTAANKNGLVQWFGVGATYHDIRDVRFMNEWKADPAMALLDFSSDGYNHFQGD